MKHIIDTTTGNAILIARGGAHTYHVTADLVHDVHGHNEIDNQLFNRIRFLEQYAALETAGVITSEAIAQAQERFDANKRAESKAAEQARRIKVQEAREYLATQVNRNFRHKMNFSSQFAHEQPNAADYDNLLLATASKVRVLMEKVAEQKDIIASPAKLRSLLKKAEAAEQRSKIEAKLMRQIKTAMSKLPKHPAEPVEGRGHVRERFDVSLNCKTARMIWDAVPAAHCYVSRYGSVLRYLSPEAFKVVDKLMAKLNA